MTTKGQEWLRLLCLSLALGLVPVSFGVDIQEPDPKAQAFLEKNFSLKDYEDAPEEYIAKQVERAIRAKVLKKGDSPAPFCQQIDQHLKQLREDTYGLKAEFGSKAPGRPQKGCFLIFSESAGLDKEDGKKSASFEDALQGLCPTFRRKIIGECGWEAKDCDPEPPALPLRGVKNIVERLKAKSLRNLEKDFEGCMVGRVIEELDRASEFSFANITLDRFKKMRNFNERFYQWLLASKAHKESAPLAKAAIRRLDPWGPLGDPEDTLNSFCKLRITHKNGDVLDIRHLVLVDDIHFNSKVQRRVNSMLRQRAAPCSRISALKSDSDTCLFDDAYDAEFGDLEKLTYPGVRLSNYEKTRKELEHKIAKAGEKEEKKSPLRVSTTLSADEAWLIDHHPFTSGDFLGKDVNLEKMPDAKTYLKNIERAKREWSAGIESVSREAFSSYRPGDFLLQSSKKQIEYKGSRLGVEGALTHAVTRSDVSHAGVMLFGTDRGNLQPRILHSMDESERDVVGTQIARLGLGSQYYTKGYQFNLSKIASPALQHRLERKGLPPSDWEAHLREKARSYDKEFYNLRSTEFEVELDSSGKLPMGRHLITNSPSTRVLSSLPRAVAVPYLKAKGLGNTEIAIGIEEKEKKRRFDRERKALVLEDKLIEKRKQTNNLTGEGAHEICSEFAFTEGFRYLSFLEEKFREDGFISEKESAFDFPNLKVRFANLHTGRLERILKDLAKEGIVSPIGPPEGLFQKN